MFCEKCGSPIAEGTNVCPACGYGKQETSADVQTSEATSSEAAFEEPSFEPEKKSGKGKKKIIIAAIACVAALAIVLTTILNFDALKGFAIKTFGSDDAYYGYVEKKAFEDVKDTIVNSYGDLKENSGTRSLSSTVGFNVGDDINSLLSIGVDKEIFDFIDNASIKFDVAQKDALSQVKLGLSVSENPIFNLDAISDIANGKSYLGIPDMLEGYLTQAVEVAQGQLIIYDEEFWNAMPDEDVVEKLLDKYFDLVIDSITQVEKTDGEIKVGDITQKCSVIKFEISPEFILNVAEKTLTELKSDKDIEKTIKDVNEYLVKKELVDSDENAYSEFVKGIDEELKDIKKAKEELADEETALTIITYVNSNDEVIGREISLANEIQLSTKTARDGENFATQIAVNDAFEITGKGTQKGDLINGEYQITIDGSDMFVVTFKDFNASKASEGVYSGSVKLSGTDDLWRELGLNGAVNALIKLYDPAIEFVVNNTEDATDVQINLLGKDKVLFGISFNTKTSKLPDITIPGVTVDGQDQAAIDQWLEDFDLEGIKDKLGDAGVSEDIVDGLFGMIESALEDSADDTDDYEDGIEYVYGDESDWY